MADVTIRDVAKRAGVGVGTVSRVLNNYKKVKDSTRQRVLAAIRELDYKPTSAATSLSRKARLSNIGVMMPSFVVYPSMIEVFRGVQTALDSLKSNYEIILYNVHVAANRERQLQTITQTRAVEGLLLVDINLTPEQYQLLDLSGIATVGLHSEEPGTGHVISLDYQQSTYTAARYLLEQGHRRIAYVGDDFDADTSLRRSILHYEGYLRALDEAGIAPLREYTQTGPHGYGIAQLLMASLLQLPELPSAIVAMSDTQALGCISAIKEAGLRVPDDISVIGQDNLEIAYHVGLTTVDTHLELLGRIAMEYLLRIIDQDDAQVPELPGIEIIERSTVRAQSP